MNIVMQRNVCVVTICLVAGLITSLVRAENATSSGEVSVPYPTILNLAVEWSIEGDDDLDGVVSVQFRAVGESSWRPAMPLRRVPAGKSRGTTPIFEWRNK